MGLCYSKDRRPDALKKLQKHGMETLPDSFHVNASSLPLLTTRKGERHRPRHRHTVYFNSVPHSPSYEECTYTNPSNHNAWLLYNGPKKSNSEQNFNVNPFRADIPPRIRSPYSQSFSTMSANGYRAPGKGVAEFNLRRYTTTGVARQPPYSPLRPSPLVSNASENKFQQLHLQPPPRSRSFTAPQSTQPFPPAPSKEDVWQPRVDLSKPTVKSKSGEQIWVPRTGSQTPTRSEMRTSRTLGDIKSTAMHTTEMSSRHSISDFDQKNSRYSLNLSSSRSMMGPVVLSYEELAAADDFSTLPRSENSKNSNKENAPPSTPVPPPEFEDACETADKLKRQSRELSVSEFMLLRGAASLDGGLHSVRSEGTLPGSRSEYALQALRAIQVSSLRPRDRSSASSTSSLARIRKLKSTSANNDLFIDEKLLLSEVSSCSSDSQASLRLTDKSSNDITKLSDQDLKTSSTSENKLTPNLPSSYHSFNGNFVSKPTTLCLSETVRKSSKPDSISEEADEGLSSSSQSLSSSRSSSSHSLNMERSKPSTPKTNRNASSLPSKTESPISEASVESQIYPHFDTEDCSDLNLAFSDFNSALSSLITIADDSQTAFNRRARPIRKKPALPRIFRPNVPTKKPIYTTDSKRNELYYSLFERVDQFIAANQGITLRRKKRLFISKSTPGCLHDVKILGRLKSLDGPSHAVPKSSFSSSQKHTTRYWERRHSMPVTNFEWAAASATEEDPLQMGSLPSVTNVDEIGLTEASTDVELKKAMNKMFIVSEEDADLNEDRKVASDDSGIVKSSAASSCAHVDMSDLLGLISNDDPVLDEYEYDV